VDANTTWHLVADIERVRAALAIDSWHVFGGSWGSTLALAYAATHPDSVRSLCLRGIFLARQREIDWLYQHGASEVFPDAWEAYIAPIPADERGDMLGAYHRRLFGDDVAEQLRCAQAWSVWEGTISRLEATPGAAGHFAEPAFALRFARIEAHYFRHRAFFASDGWLLDQVDVFRHLPTVIVQGRYDMVCPVRTAWDLAAAWPEARLRIVTAGHSSFDPAIASALVTATDQLAADDANTIG
jgi:proline iminopeptidase